MADNKRTLLDVKGENVRIWRRDFEGRNGKFYRYTVGASNKNEDGSWSNAYIQVSFTRSANAPEKIQNGAVCDFEGFLSARAYMKDGKEVTEPVIKITKVKFYGNVGEDVGNADSYEQLSEDLPF